MKTIGKLALALAVSLAAATGTVAVSPTPAQAAFAPPWYADVTYYLSGAAVGSTRYYCDGRVVDRGNVYAYDDSVYVQYFVCPA